jgi:hypothetical protein
LAYADTYDKSGQYTGPGDEALLEKYFELAKPSSGFRMSQQQIDLLKNSKSWKDSIVGAAYHAATGRWFPDNQRNEIIQTMRMLGASKNTPTAASSVSTPASGGVEHWVRDKNGKLVKQ